MNYSFDESAWVDHRRHLTSEIGRCIDKLSYAFKRLNAIQYDAPWERSNNHATRAIPKRHSCDLGA